MFRKILLGVSESFKEKNLELVVSLAQKTGAYLVVLLVIDDRLCHYGEVDPLASSRSRKEFVSYVLKEGYREAQKRQENLKKLLSKTGLFYRICLKQGTPLETLIKTAHTEKVDMIVVEREALTRSSYGKLLKEAPADLLFI